MTQVLRDFFLLPQALRGLLAQVLRDLLDQVLRDFVFLPGPSGSFGSGPLGFFFYPRSFGIFDPDPSGSTASGPLGSFGPQVIQHLPPPGSFAALLPDVHHSSWGHSCAFFFFCYSVQGLSIIDCEPKHPVQSFHFFGAMVE